MSDFPQHYQISCNGIIYHFRGQGSLYNFPIGVFSRTIDGDPEILICLTDFGGLKALTVNYTFPLEPDTVIWIRGEGSFWIEEGKEWPRIKTSAQVQESEIVTLIPATDDTAPARFSTGAALADSDVLMGYAVPAMRGESFTSPYKLRGSEETPVLIDAFGVDIAQIYPSNMPTHMRQQTAGELIGKDHELLRDFKASVAATATFVSTQTQKTLRRIHDGYAEVMAKDHPEHVQALPQYGNIFSYQLTKPAVYRLMTDDKNSFVLTSDDSPTGIFLSPGRAIISFFGYEKAGKKFITGAFAAYADERGIYKLPPIGRIPTDLHPMSVQQQATLLRQVYQLAKPPSGPEQGNTPQ